MSSLSTERWSVNHNEIIWRFEKGDIHSDNIEMAGTSLAVVVDYGSDDGVTLRIKKNLHYPTLRTIPNNTHATLSHSYDENALVKFSLNGVNIVEELVEVSISGLVKTVSKDSENKLRITRFHFPSVDKMAYVEHVTVTNVSGESVSLNASLFSEVSYARGTKGVYVLEASTDGSTTVVLDPGQTEVYDTVFTGRLILERRPHICGITELVRRMDYVRGIFENGLILESNDPILNCEFNFSKLRATESIYETSNGPMHSPGGQHYYAAVWTNDQAEYAAPYFGFAGNDLAHRACVNLIELYKPFMHPELHHIPASIISEGIDIWEAWGDEGDAAQYIYGISRYLLENGDPCLAEKYFNTLDWCARYELTKETDDHLISADADELEHRLPAGDANLLNTSLVYGGLMCTSYIAKDLGFNDKAEKYEAFAARLRGGMENALGADIDGYHTYRYFKGYDVMRSYNVSPMTVGIFDRKDGTVKALIDKLWTEDGFLSAENDSMFWDRSTLYALRGIIRAGYADVGYDYLSKYSRKRLTGDRVPYPVEAWPEGAQRHLSAESALYARTVIEGIFGINPTGFRKFTICPSVPESMNKIALRRIKAFGGCFDVEIEKAKDSYQIFVRNVDGREQYFKITTGDTIEVNL